MDILNKEKYRHILKEFPLGTFNRVLRIQAGLSEVVSMELGMTVFVNAHLDYLSMSKNYICVMSIHNELTGVMMHEVSYTTTFSQEIDDGFEIGIDVINRCRFQIEEYSNHIYPEVIKEEPCAGIALAMGQIRQTIITTSSGRQEVILQL